MVYPVRIVLIKHCE